jgi:hypothetical protein
LAGSFSAFGITKPGFVGGKVLIAVLLARMFCQLDIFTTSRLNLLFQTQKFWLLKHLKFLDFYSLSITALLDVQILNTRWFYAKINSILVVLLHPQPLSRQFKCGIDLFESHRAIPN